ncbi:hypothetical protein [Pinirhizobacter sp.]|jgi:transcriptional regulator with XRE-family HTH domain|uniref:helix-turn-helix domain-containing protein n=1 Tax=Pinirhizobacter sp. TaxID=2950432 RepID=UPI002F3F7CB3
MEPDLTLFLIGAARLGPQELRDIGVRLRQQRELLGFTLSDVALGCQRFDTILLANEQGEKRPSLNLLYWLAKAGADVNFILIGAPAPSNPAYSQPHGETFVDTSVREPQGNAMSARESFGYAHALQLGNVLVTRMSGESIDAYVARRDEAACKLVASAAERGTPLNTFLTKGFLGVPEELHAKTLRSLAAEILSGGRPQTDSSLSLVPLASGPVLDERPVLHLA